MVLIMPLVIQIIPVRPTFILLIITLMIQQLTFSGCTMVTGESTLHSRGKFMKNGYCSPRSTMIYWKNCPDNPGQFFYVEVDGTTASGPMPLRDLWVCVVYPYVRCDQKNNASQRTLRECKGHNAIVD